MRDQKPKVLEKHPIGEKTTFRGRRRGRKLRPQLDKLFKESLHTFLVEEATESEKIDFKTFFFSKARRSMARNRFWRRRTFSMAS